LDFLSGLLLPALLLTAGCFFGFRVRFFWIFHPLRTLRLLREAASSDGTSPFAALTVALAGTLGVGNIAGVAAAIASGGPGALFWMLIGAFAAMSVKYAEVTLAVRCRRIRCTGRGTEYYGGAPYYILDGISSLKDSIWVRRTAGFLSKTFAFFCALNALLTGNILQVRAAVSCVPLPPLFFGVLFALLFLILSGWGIQKLSALTSVLIPLLAALFILLSGIILFANHEKLPEILLSVWEDAWHFRPAAGGFAGFGISRAVRYGITRGIFSNEAGCGTAPTAHASADVRSPKHQGCFGIFEVFADTVLLCSLTGLVILLYRGEMHADGMLLSLSAYSSLAAEIGGNAFGCAAGILLRVSVVFFAFAALISQSCYGTEAIRFLFPYSRARICFRLISTAVVLLGSVIPVGFMWNCADAVVSVMTVINILCLFLLRKQIPT